jgi:hypothetical protein
MPRLYVGWLGRPAIGVDLSLADRDNTAIALTQINITLPQSGMEKAR